MTQAWWKGRGLVMMRPARSRRIGARRAYLAGGGTQPIRIWTAPPGGVQGRYGGAGVGVVVREA